MSLLAFGALPRATAIVAASIVLAFAYWKSPLSQPLIESINALAPVRIGRVVDYSDLLALLVMPAAYHVARRADAYRLGGPMLRKILAVPVFAVSFLAMMGTTVLPYTDRYSIRRPEAGDAFDSALAASIIAEVAKKHGLECFACGAVAERAEYRGRSMTLSYEIRERKIIAFTIEDYPDFFFNRATARMDKLRNDLQAELGMRLPSMEFVMPLPANRRRQ
jgi:hypothetical protein